MMAAKRRCMSDRNDAGRNGAPPPVVFRRSFPARPDAVRLTLISFGERMLPHAGADLTGRSELVLAELLNNIALHGHAGDPGPEPLIDLCVAARPDGLCCSISDDGALLPESCLSPRLPEPAGHPEGGFGWFLIDHLTRSLGYSRENGRNHLAFMVPANAPEPH